MIRDLEDLNNSGKCHPEVANWRPQMAKLRFPNKDKQGHPTDPPELYGQGLHDEKGRGEGHS